MSDEIAQRKEFEAWFLRLNRDFTRSELATTKGEYFYTTTAALWEFWKQLAAERENVRVLREAAEAMRKDLLMRADYTDDDGKKVVNCGMTVWRKFNDALQATAPEQEDKNEHNG